MIKPRKPEEVQEAMKTAEQRGRLTCLVFVVILAVVVIALTIAGGGIIHG